MKSKNNLLDKKPFLSLKNIVILWALTLVAIFGQLSVFAHGGEDHGEEQSSTPTASVGEVNTKLAKASTTEALIKYPTPKLGEQITIRIFLTDLITNVPVDTAKVTLKFQYLGTNQKTSLSSVPSLIPTVQADTSDLVVNATATSTAGMYEAKVTFPSAGQYTLLASFNNSTLDAQAFISGIVVTEPPQITINNSSSSIVTITIVIITLVSMIMLVLLYLFFLATDNSKQTKVHKDIV